MDILDKLNNYAAGYRDGDEFAQETVFAEVTAAIIEELRGIRAALESADTKWSTPRDTRERSRQDA